MFYGLIGVIFIAPHLPILGAVIVGLIMFCVGFLLERESKKE